MKIPLLSHFIRVGLLFALTPSSGVLGQETRATTRTLPRATMDTTALITKKELVTDRRFTLKGWKGDLQQAKIIDLAGNDITGLLAPKSDNGVVTLAQPMRPFIMKTRTPQVVALSETGETVLPGGMVLALSPAPDGGGPTKAIWFRLFCAISPRPAPWDNDKGTYVTRLKFVVRPTDDSPTSIALPHPVTVSLEFEGMVAQEVPGFTITQAGLENQKEIELRFRPSTAQPKLKVRSTISDSDVTIDALSRLELRPARTMLLGFGLENVTVAVAQIRADGEPSLAAAATNVDVQVSGAARREGADDVVIPSGESRTEFTLRSSGLGKVTVRATAGALTGTTELNQRFPVGPLVATLLGGALGGLARRWVKGARKRSTLRNVIEGVVVGLVAFVAAVLGVGYLDLPAAIAATEAGAFLTSVLCGFVGVTVLSSLTDRLKVGAEK